MAKIRAHHPPILRIQRAIVLQLLFSIWPPRQLGDYIRSSSMKNYMYIVVGSVRFGWVACHVDDAPWPFGPFVRSPGDIEISLHYSRQALTVNCSPVAPAATLLNSLDRANHKFGECNEYSLKKKQ